MSDRSTSSGTIPTSAGPLTACSCPVDDGDGGDQAERVVAGQQQHGRDDLRHAEPRCETTSTALRENRSARAPPQLEQRQRHRVRRDHDARGPRSESDASSTANVSATQTIELLGSDTAAPRRTTGTAGPSADAPRRRAPLRCIMTADSAVRGPSSARHRGEGNGVTIDRSAAGKFVEVMRELAVVIANRADRPKWNDRSFFKRFSRPAAPLAPARAAGETQTGRARWPDFGTNSTTHTPPPPGEMYSCRRGECCPRYKAENA